MSDHELIIKNIQGYITLTEHDSSCFLSLLERKDLKRKERLLHAGEICRYSAFVIKGCLRGYSYDPDGTEHVLNFAPVNWWIADMYSLIAQKPGTLNIEAVEDTRVLLLTKINQEKLYKQAPVFERFFRIITENSLVAYQQRLLDNLSLTAEQRYQIFCNKYPMLIHQLPLKQIASYIGVTPEFFSKMRKKLLLETK
jgi:CRP-like cAMP-binding protein